ncbi:uncharacterized protein LOC120353658 [Nilaparvata lugens]|uniref:uncharacterized protein LOC120353658 n=1 Tax=Nilaparvata lugens TaxID=108931 RepID=UPI00193DFC8C|nr:uncharacterized protein LOC120353658 [Nilaparvata lugens]
MFLSRIFTIFILVSIGSLRSNARPSDSFDKTADSTEPLSQTFVISGKRQDAHQLSVESCRAKIKDSQELTSKILSGVDDLIAKQNNLTGDETILVLGEAGAGKTSLIQFLTGNPDLQSREIAGKYVIEDGQRIGEPNSGSSTLYPRIVPFNRAIDFVDFPGYQNITQPANEIASSIIVKTITNKLKKAKILLLVDHATLQQKDGFINSLRPLYYNLRFNFDDYKDRIALIVTKVSPKLDDDEILKVQETSGSDTARFLEEEAHIMEQVMEYLNQTQSSLKDKLELEMGYEEEGLHYDSMQLLNSLKTGSKDGKAPRINVFYHPNKPGPLRDNKLMLQNRESLLETVRNLTSFDVKKYDFGFGLSDRTNVFLKCLLEMLSDLYRNKVKDIVNSLENSAHGRITDGIFLCIQKISDLQSLINRTELFIQENKQVVRYDEFSKTLISSDLATLSPRHPEIGEIRIFDFLEKYGEIIMGFVDTSEIFELSPWTERIRDALQLMEKEKEWCNTLLKFIEGLSSYKIQSQRNKIYDEMYTVKPTSNNVEHPLISMFLDITDSSPSQLFENPQIISERKLSEIDYIARGRLEKSRVLGWDDSCSSQGSLRVKGFIICMSHINSDEFLDSRCGNKSVTDLIIFATYKVFIDIQNLNKRLEGVDIYLAAPYWEVIGERTDIKLVGREGQRVSDSIYLENGKDGKPGLAGGMGGSFYGLGMRFLNCENLHIMSVGGKGGPGIDGADGKPGKDGKSGYEKAVEVLGSKRGLKNYLEHEITQAHDSLELTESILRDGGSNISMSGDKIGGDFLGLSTYKFGGDCGRVGELGGYGGRGGFGGLGGKFEVVEAGDHRSNITFLSKNGEDGENGKRGQSGGHGNDGTGLTCYNIKTTEQASNGSTSYWKCFETDSRCSHDVQPEIECRPDHYIDTGIERPSRRSPYELFRSWSINHPLSSKEDLSTSERERDLRAIKALGDFERFFWSFSD